MAYDNELKEKALELYREGYSYGLIHKTLGVARSTVTLWCKDIATDNRSRTGMKRYNPLNPDKIKTSQFAPHPFEGMLIQKATPSCGLERLKLQDPNTRNILTITRSRYNMSVHLGRLLEPHERVVHINGKSSDLSNLKLTVKGIYQQKEKKPRRLKPIEERKSPKQYTNTCEICEESFKTIVEHKDVCNKKSCKDIVKELVLTGTL